MTTPLILLTNDDGIHAPGLAALHEALADLGEVLVFAPDRQRSAVGHGVSLNHPLRRTEIRPGWHMVDGTPTDCIILAVRGVLEVLPSLIVSGINSGANLGDDVTYSGTVAGAFEGMLQKIPSFAISVTSHFVTHFAGAQRMARLTAEKLLAEGLPEDVMLNINVPDLPADQISGISVTAMGRRNYNDRMDMRRDPRGGTYYWIGGEIPEQKIETGTDFEALEAGRISVTPLKRDMTDYDMLKRMASYSALSDKL
ncbi:MAG TPA: 5'/3'-nucleotidase SurE [Candidatus Hydrogenedentes bacterium]|nr:5'/3'-nucleotidase SurE [Candidatus Hydrogenedentota bacterium]HPX87375.1 5'/3'-nucleotidase SurE [Candidatus Hydrogenedentota bacterium]